MKLTKLTFLAAIILLPILGIAQSKINYLDFPSNTIAVAPTNIFFDGNGNTMFYKRLIKRSETHLNYLRIGTEFYSLFRKDGANNANYSLNVGWERLKKLGSFAISFGLEGAIVYRSIDGRHVEPGANTIFASQSSTQGTTNSEIDKGTFFLYSAIGFVGVKYHINNHFAVGIESAAGLGFYQATDKLLDGGKESLTGVINDIDPSRMVTVEYNF